jgi:hypothetical protein
MGNAGAESQEESTGPIQAQLRVWADCVPKVSASFQRSSLHDSRLGVGEMIAE